MYIIIVSIYVDSILIDYGEHVIIIIVIKPIIFTSICNPI